MKPKQTEIPMALQQSEIEKTLTQANKIARENLPAIVDKTKNEIATKSELPAAIEKNIEHNPYGGIGDLDITKEEGEKLIAPIDENDVEIRPDGIIYYPGVKYRNRLNQIFGPGKWGMRPIDLKQSEGDGQTRIYYHGALYIRGKFAAEAVGGHDFYGNNATGSFDASSESAKTDALTRCCKDLGIASELWEPGYIIKWKANHATAKWYIYMKEKSKDYGTKKLLWTRNDRPDIGWPWQLMDGNKKQPDQKNTEPEKSAFDESGLDDMGKSAEQVQKEKADKEAYYARIAENKLKLKPETIKMIDAALPYTTRIKIAEICELALWQDNIICGEMETIIAMAETAKGEK